MLKNLKYLSNHSLIPKQNVYINRLFINIFNFGLYLNFLKSERLMDKNPKIESSLLNGHEQSAQSSQESVNYGLDSRSNREGQVSAIGSRPHSKV